jgi:hypothetical protein
MVFVGVGGLREVASVAVLGRQRKQVSSGREHHAVAVGREVEIGTLCSVLLANGLLPIDPVRSRPRAVVRHDHVEIVQLLRREVEHVQLAALLEDDARRALPALAEAWKVDVIIGVMRDLPELVAPGIVCPDVRS